MLEANALQDVVQLDVHAEVVGVELELIARPQAAILVHIHRKRRHPAVEAEPPVTVLTAHVETDAGCVISFQHCVVCSSIDGLSPLETARNSVRRAREVRGQPGSHPHIRCMHYSSYTAFKVRIRDELRCNFLRTRPQIAITAAGIYDQLWPKTPNPALPPTEPTFLPL